MPRLLLLNGPPGIGKSTLAQMYIDDHAGVLNLDIDRVRELLGGWRDRFEVAGELARPIVRCMAIAHLSAGHDVVMPQFLGRLSEVEGWEAAAHECGAGFREVALMDTKEQSLDRFFRRGQGEDLPWHRQVQDIVERSGGRPLLAAMYDRLEGVVQSRPQCTVVPSREGTIRETYDAMCAALDPVR